MPFPSLVVGSTNDPAASAERAVVFASAWGSELVVLENVGHLNPASGHQQWETGFALLKHLVEPGALVGCA